jgi:hypothetical protein
MASADPWPRDASIATASGGVDGLSCGDAGTAPAARTPADRPYWTFSMASFVAAVGFGIIGSGYFLYGRKAQHPVALVSGVLLCVFPYFVDGFAWTMVVGAVLLAAPFTLHL